MRSGPGVLCLVIAISSADISVAAGATYPAVEQRVVVRPAPTLYLPGAYTPQRGTQGEVDCNSPAHWEGGLLYVFSSAGEPYRTSGPNLFHLDQRSTLALYDNKASGGRWIEATIKEKGGPLYGWYHYEPHPICNSATLTAPRIGAAVSSDNGLHWHDSGIVLEAPANSLNCATTNKYFAGGNGDFCVIPDQQREYVYFLISTYNRDLAEQGVAIARMRWADRTDPVGRVWKWHLDRWSEPGLGGQVTPIFTGRIDWHRADADAFWGPSVHWNTHLRQYVMLLNRAKDKDWTQEGIYVSFNANVSRQGWTPPLKILDAGQLSRSRWYPQVIGTDAAQHETDKLAGRSARLFVAGESKWELVFVRPGEPAPTTATAR